MFQKISAFIEGLDENTLDPARKETLQPLIEYIHKHLSDKEINLNYICTHNSRRSQFGQVWGKVVAAFFGYSQIKTFSGGVEVTACNERTIKALETTGFAIENPGGENPKYQVTYSENAPAIELFSKQFDNEVNPESDFAAIMTCSHADENCPFIPGAQRISVTYEDPKAFDDTPQESEAYLERSKQIATEMKYVFSQIKNA